MKLINLYIKDHLLLHELNLRFDRDGRLDEKESYRLDFLVGVNGSGKSTLLRTLVEIVLSLKGATKVGYAYKLEYELNNSGQHIRVLVNNTENSEYSSPISQIYAEDGDLLDEYHGELPIQYLPKQIVVYTTGSEIEWENILFDSYHATNNAPVDKDFLADKTKRYIHETPAKMVRKETAEAETQEEAPFLLLHSSRLNAITLCGLLRYLSNAEVINHHPLADVLDAVGIESLAGFSLRFRIYDQLSDKSLYEKLRQLNPSPTILQQASDRLVVFDLIKDPGAAQRLLDLYGGTFGLFKILDTQLDNDPTHTGSPTLQEINLFLQRKSVEPADGEFANAHIPSVFLLDWLSDGERAFLGRMALLAMFDMQDSLIILDEPEVHFNDYWKREVVSLLDGMMRGHSNHILITTHSSILLSDVTEDQITVFVKSPTGITEQRRPGIKTFGADPSEIMMVTFDTELSSGAKSEEDLVMAIQNGDREKVSGFLEMIGPGMWRFRLKQRLKEIDAASA